MQNSNTHLVFLTPGFPECEEDSTAIPALQVYLKALVTFAPYLKITIITFQYPFTKQKYYWNGILVVPLNGENSKFKKIIIWKKAYSLLKKMHFQQPITALHSFWIGECSFIGELFSKKYNIKHIVTAMGQDVYKKNKYAYHLKKSNATLVTLSHHHQTALFTNHTINSQIIPWVLDENNFPNLKENKIDILGVGSLTSIKNYTLFVEIIKNLVEIKPNIKVEIIGNGTEYAKINQLIETYNLKNTIQLKGKLSRKKVLEKMSISNILLHTSSYESFGFVFLEALYSGMKLVSFDVGFSTAIPEWKIGDSKENLIMNCLLLLDQKSNTKQRKLLFNLESVLIDYLTLYHGEIN
ncbi:glycosyltransferase [Flavobacterium sp. NRK F7]|uniref:glycosyltransferase n=1 Tax=Flavobacterium sp. NRK F7 TaxID=2954930 RepID=UPI00209137FC|nr:glycosyltransferase [Flavobacterium sp. NRK F7]MCO6162130.1 glycosyltransferase [Flavobacterium sp. NRK F7]